MSATQSPKLTVFDLFCFTPNKIKQTNKYPPPPPTENCFRWEGCKENVKINPALLRHPHFIVLRISWGQGRRNSSPSWVGSKHSDCGSCCPNQRDLKVLLCSLPGHQILSSLIYIRSLLFLRLPSSLPNPDWPLLKNWSSKVHFESHIYNSLLALELGWNYLPGIQHPRIQETEINIEELASNCDLKDSPVEP